jgi:hypothetical protein
MHLICQTDAEVAHPGESWLWENSEEFRVVVDVGAHEPFARRAAAFEPDVLVLTHDDNDHIGAAMSFFDQRAAEPPMPSTRPTSLGRPAFRRPFEVWMPYDWSRLGIVAAQAVDAAMRDARSAETTATGSVAPDVTGPVDPFDDPRTSGGAEQRRRKPRGFEVLVHDDESRPGGLTLDEALDTLRRYGDSDRIVDPVHESDPQPERDAPARKSPKKPSDRNSRPSPDNEQARAGDHQSRVAMSPPSTMPR